MDKSSSNRTTHSDITGVTAIDTVRTAARNHSPSRPGEFHDLEAAERRYRFLISENLPVGVTLDGETFSVEIPRTSTLESDVSAALDHALTCVQDEMSRQEFVVPGTIADLTERIFASITAQCPSLDHRMVQGMSRGIAEALHTYDQATEAAR